MLQYLYTFCDIYFIRVFFYLLGYGLDEDNLRKEEMTDLLKALNFSKATVHQEQLLQKRVRKYYTCSLAKIMYLPIINFVFYYYL